MSDEIARAFGHPEARIAGEGPADPPDRLSLRDYVTEADIGAFQVERGHPQRLRFNIAVELKPHEAAADDVDRILSYDRLTEAVVAALSGRRLDLLETLAEDVAARILHAPQAARVFLRIEKLDRGPGALGVEIVRSADTGAGNDAGPDATGAIVVHLDNATIAGAGLGRLIDALARPAVLTVGYPAEPRPQTGHLPTQRRVDLLAIEQSAWALAARDARCVVVASRTEIDWAMRRAGLVVWAPSKMVLDSPSAPKAVDPVAMALWLSEEIGAREMVVHADVAIPATSRVSVRRG